LTKEAGSLERGGNVERASFSLYYSFLNERKNIMAESVYKVVVLVGTSTESWDKAAAAAIEDASRTLRDLRVARIVEQDVHIESGKELTYRVKMELSFKYEGSA